VRLYTDAVEVIISCPTVELECLAVSKHEISNDVVVTVAGLSACRVDVTAVLVATVTTHVVLASP